MPSGDQESGTRAIGVFGARKAAREIEADLQKAQADLKRLGLIDVVALEDYKQELDRNIAETQKFHSQQLEAQRSELDRLVVDRRTTVAQLERQIVELRAEVVETEEIKILQEAGLYEYRHPLEDSVAYEKELDQLRKAIKFRNKPDGGAVTGARGWTVNGSTREGEKMVREYSKLMLRAFNAEADGLVKNLKPYKLDKSIDRLRKVAATIEKLGKTMQIRVSEEYLNLRVRELEWTADFRNKQAEEKEREREEKARLREEKKVQQEIERERARLVKERDHFVNALASLEASGDEDGAARLREQLAEVESEVAAVDFRAANVRAGYVYVISNFGSFGEEVVKIGMTRRLEPRDRIRELSDASVPYNFDVHALFFAEDAVGIETEMHRRFADRRVNLVNTRREFFHVTPHEAKTVLVELAGELLEFDESAAAEEFRQSEAIRTKPYDSSVEDQVAALSGEATSTE